MRKGVLGLAVVLSFSLLPAYSATPIKAGTNCSKQGVAKTYNDKRYTCIKSGKKLVWSEGKKVEKKISVPTKSPSPLVNPSTSPTSAPYPNESSNSSPSPSPSASSIKTLCATSELQDQDETSDMQSELSGAPRLFNSLENLQSNYNFIEDTAFNEVKRNSQKGKTETSNANIHIGPNTYFCDSNPDYLFKRAQETFSEFDQPSSIDVVYVQIDDLQWATEKWNELTSSKWEFPGARNCRSKTWCSGATAHPGIISIAISPNINLDFVGVTEIHEYTHIMQWHLKKDGNLNTPIWWMEGQAMFFGVSGASNNFAQYMRVQKSQRATFKQVPGMKFDVESIKIALLERPKPGDRNQTSIGYSIGMKFIEALIAMKGIHINLQIWQQLRENISFEQAFKKAYGVSLNQAVDTIAPIIANYYK